MIGPDGCHWVSYEEYVSIGVCGLCGCSSDEIRDDVLAVLRQMFERDGCVYYTEFSVEGTDKYKELLVTLLDNVYLNDKGPIVEHGTAIRGSWLTPEGKEILRPLFDPSQTR